MPPRLAELIRKARRLASERDRLIDELWAGLTEEAVRRLGKSGKVPAPALRLEAADVITKVRERVEATLGEG